MAASEIKEPLNKRTLAATIEKIAAGDSRPGEAVQKDGVPEDSDDQAQALARKLVQAKTQAENAVRERLKHVDLAKNIVAQTEKAFSQAMVDINEQTHMAQVAFTQLDSASKSENKAKARAEELEVRLLDWCVRAKKQAEEETKLFAHALKIAKTEKQQTEQKHAEQITKAKAEAIAQIEQRTRLHIQQIKKAYSDKTAKLQAAQSDEISKRDQQIQHLKDQLAQQEQSHTKIVDQLVSEAQKKANDFSEQIKTIEDRSKASLNQLIIENTASLKNLEDKLTKKHEVNIRSIEDSYNRKIASIRCSFEEEIDSNLKRIALLEAHTEEQTHYYEDAIAKAAQKAQVQAQAQIRERAKEHSQELAQLREKTQDRQLRQEKTIARLKAAIRENERKFSEALELLKKRAENDISANTELVENLKNKVNIQAKQLEEAESRNLEMQEDHRNAMDALEKRLSDQADQMRISFDQEIAAEKEQALKIETSLRETIENIKSIANEDIQAHRQAIARIKAQAEKNAQTYNEAMARAQEKIIKGSEHGNTENEKTYQKQISALKEQIEQLKLSREQAVATSRQALAQANERCKKYAENISAFRSQLQEKTMLYEQAISQAKQHISSLAEQRKQIYSQAVEKTKAYADEKLKNYAQEAAKAKLQADEKVRAYAESFAIATARKQNNSNSIAQSNPTTEPTETNAPWDMNIADVSSSRTGSSLLSLRARDIMQKQVFWADPEDNVKQALRKMDIHNTSYLLVGNDGRVESVISKADLTGQLSPYLDIANSSGDQGSGKDTSQIKLKWITVNDIQTITPDTSVADIIKAMRSNGGRPLPVSDTQKRAIGLVTPFNVLKVKALLNVNIDTGITNRQNAPVA